ncbi:DUF4269 domain-containing protein [Acuticoccus kandeliae]|uniref:DUF4269 domain-containing protein n=1 Tax=Acuticoccus kandeliae TaxID=2073160 RepID=UPI000D3E7B6F|nr:DUF4269 domain-containing protein [Acuticoccus kandeliae]
MARLPWHAVLPALDPGGALAPFDPRIAGTPPLGLDRPDSDIDILCHAPDMAAFLAALTPLLAGQADVRLWQWRDAPRPLVARFMAFGWEVEIFASAEPVAHQNGWHHFEIERRLLALGGPALRARIMTLRERGLKTEPAFAAALGLKGDPYAALLALAALDEPGLAALIAANVAATG